LGLLELRSFQRVGREAMSFTNLHSSFSFFRTSIRDRSDRSVGQFGPEIIAVVKELVPFLVGVLVFGLAFIAHTAAFTLELLSRDSIGSVFGVAVLGSVIAFAVFRQFSPPFATIDKSFVTCAVLNSLTLLVAFAVLAAVIFALRTYQKHDLILLGSWFLGSALILTAALYLFRAYAKFLEAEGRMVEKVAIYGRSDAAAKVVRALADNDHNTSVLGFYDDILTNEVECSMPFTGGMQDLVECARSGSIDRIVVALPLNDHKRISNVMAMLEMLPTPVQLCPDDLPPACNVRGANKLGPIILLDVQNQPLGVQGMIVKSIMDYLIAVLAFVILAPLMILIMLAIKLDSPGPIFFVQSRGGYPYRDIRIIKFRTMTVLEDGPTVVQARRNDSRITRIGRFLRRTSLDELPQLLNVLRGELSVVGPRPHALAHDQYYGKIIKEYAIRQKIKPGITGWAQVNGYRSETCDPKLMRQRVKHDRYYIENWSPWLDIQILFKTVKAIFFDRNAY